MSKTVTLLKVPGDEVKTPQIRVMLNVLNEKVGVGNAVILSELYTAIDADERFISRQGAQRVWKFYEKRLIEDGLVEIAGVDEKPAKEPKAKSDGEKPQRSASKRAKGGEGGGDSADAESPAAA